MPALSYSQHVSKFEAKYDLGADDACWLWKGQRTKQKTWVYGLVNFDGRTQLAHRVSYQLYVGKIHEGCNVCHTCDNTLCVNPKHLFAATQRVNMLDCLKKGRHKRVAKLTDEQVLEIRARIGSTSGVELAREYGVCSASISHIKSGKRWSHVK